MVLSFFSIMLAVRYVSKDAFGTYMLMQVISLFFVLLGDFGTHTTVTKYIVGNPETLQKKTVHTIICYKVGIVLLLSGIILACKPAVTGLFDSPVLSALYVYLPLLFFCESFYALFISILQGFHRYKRMAQAQVLMAGGYLVLMVVFVVLLGFGIQGLLWARIAALGGAVLYQLSSIPVSPGLRFDGKLFKDMFSFSLPLGFNRMLNFTFTKIDRFMIGAMMSPMGLALYEVADRIPTSSRQLYDSFRSVFFPHMAQMFSKQKPEKSEALLNNSVRLVTFITLFCALGAFLFQKEIITIIFTVDYLESASAFSLLMFSLAIGLIGNMFGTSLVAAGHPTPPVIVNCFVTIINVIGNLVMIPRFGFLGAVYATVISNCAAHPFLVFYLKSRGIAVSITAYVKPLLVFLVCCGGFVLLGSDFLLLKITVLGLYVVLSWWSNVIYKNDFTPALRRDAG